MFNKGLSLDQAPPIEVILRFFLTTPLFGVLAAAAILFADPEMLLHWDAPAVVAVVHLLMLGVAAMAMVGALFQMLPVIAGASISEPLYHARWIHMLMVVGIVLLSASFYFDRYILMHPAVPLLVGSLGFVIYLMLSKLVKVENKTASVKGMMVSLASLGFGILFALLLTAIFMDFDIGLDPMVLRSVHIHFMLVGWIGVLVMAVAFQVIEMFYVTPPYPREVTDIFPAAVFVLLILFFAVSYVMPEAAAMMDILLVFIFFIFAAVTLRRLSRRKRPVADATVLMWRTAMISLAAASVAAFLSNFIYADVMVSAASLLFGYFVLSVIFAMSYKIVPFLVWFHLNAKGVIECPMMGDIIPSKRAMAHLWLHWGLLAAGAALSVTPYAWKAVGAFMAAEFLLYGANLVRAAKIYQSLKDKGIL